MKLTAAQTQAKKRKKERTKAKKKIVKKYPEKYSMDMCLAKRRNSKGKLRYCKKKALKNGRCKLHGSGGRKPTIGLYSANLTGNYQELYEKFRNDPNILNLEEEIAFLRLVVTRIHDVMDKLTKKKKDMGQDEWTSNMEKEIDLLEKLGENVERISRVVEKARKAGEGLLPIEALQQCLTQIVYLTNYNISFCPHCNGDLATVKQGLFESFKELKVPAKEAK